MLNLRIAGNFLSGYYLADPTQFLSDERGNLGEADRDQGVRELWRLVRRAQLDLDDTSSPAATRKAVVPLLATLGFELDTGAATTVTDELAADAVVPGPDGSPLCYVVLAQASQHLDANPSGRRQGDSRPQRRLERLLRHGAAPFGLATNGRELRVVARDPGLGGEAAYLAVDLAGLAEAGDRHEWNLIWALLRPEAMRPGADGTSLYARAQKASEAAAARVSEDLSVGVRRAIEALCQGAIDDLRARGAQLPDLRELFADALKIAYRLLFCAFAEDRGLLPSDAPAYRSSYGFGHLRDQVLAPHAEWTGDRRYLWDSMSALFRLLRDGADAGEFQVATYNGRLFDPEHCPSFDLPVPAADGHARPVRLADHHVATALRELSLTQPARRGRGRKRPVAHGGGEGRRRVNYRELNVEQLGSVYEGLLAFEPRLSTGPMVLAELAQGGKKIVQMVVESRVPAGATILERLPADRFYLFEASGQRKGSGSYYTPRALATFLAREAIEPLVAGRSSEDILELRILDPSMGSGAFLVPAVHLLAEAYGRARVAEGLDADGRIDDDERAAYRRLVVERCIYGVDKNPMAVELAKMSLWLATASRNRPLSFLDANLRCGDSLVGAFLDDLDRLPAPLVKGRVAADSRQGRLPLPAVGPSLAHLVSGRGRIAGAPSELPEEVHVKGQQLRDLLDDEGVRHLRARADLWVGAFFWPASASPLDAGTYRAFASHLAECGRLPQPLAQDALERVKTEVRPFHWELEFTEVFFDETGRRRGDSGFDAVLGNPPWEGIVFKPAEFYPRFEPTFAFARTKEGKRALADALLKSLEVRHAFKEINERLDSNKNYIKSSGQYSLLGVGGTFNFYRAFLERDMQLLAPAGHLALTLDSGLLADAATQYHRHALFEGTEIRTFALFDNSKRIFPIDSREQFLALHAVKGGRTEVIPFAADLTEIVQLDALEQHTIALSLSVVRRLAPETMAIPDVRDTAVLDALGSIYGRHALLFESAEGRPWIAIYHRELDIDKDDDLFGRLANGIPVYEGKQMHQFDTAFGKPLYRMHTIGIDELVRREWRRAGHRERVPEHVPRLTGEARLGKPNRRGGIELPLEGYRLSLRKIARATDERSLIASVIPAGIALGDALPFFHRSAQDDPVQGYRTLMDTDSMLFLCGLLNSMVLDFVLRRKVSSNVTKAILATLPIPDPPVDSPGRAAIVGLAGRLTCVNPAFEELANVVGVRCGPLSSSERFALRAELDARVAHLYGLPEAQLRLVLADFRESKGEGTPVSPNDAYKQAVLDEFDRLGRSAGSGRAEPAA